MAAAQIARSTREFLDTTGLKVAHEVTEFCRKHVVHVYPENSRYKIRLEDGMNLP
jgi:hypothetical protein